MLMQPCRDINSIYKSLGKLILQEGRLVNPRGFDTYELNDVVLIAWNPRVRVIQLKNRRYNPVFGLIEFLHFFTGDSKPDMLSHYVKNVKNFVNPATGLLDGCYAPRLTNLELYDPRVYPKRKTLRLNQLELVYRRLKKDPNTRRAVISIYNPVYDYNDDSLDIPCNDFLIFRQIDGKLNLTVICRSSDYYIGFIYDTFEFQLLQEVVAGWLGLDVGDFIYHLASVHLYARDAEKFKKCESVKVDYKPRDARVSYDEWQSILQLMLKFEESVRAGQNLLTPIIINEFDTYWSSFMNCIRLHNALKYKLPIDLDSELKQFVSEEFMLPMKDFWGDASD